MAVSLDDQEFSPEAVEEVEERQEDVAESLDESKKVDLAARHTERLKRLKDLRLRRVRIKIASLHIASWLCLMLP